MLLQLCFDSEVEVFLIFDSIFGVYFFSPFFYILTFRTVYVYSIDLFGKEMGCTLYNPQQYLYNKCEVYIRTDLIWAFYSFQTANMT